MDNRADVATRFLRALDAGQVPPELKQELAATGAALGDHITRLAQEVEEGGPFSWRRAVELAELVFQLGQAAVSRPADEERGD